jgi:hypothetical protein
VGQRVFAVLVSFGGSTLEQFDRLAQGGSTELALSVSMPLRVAFLIIEVQLGSLIVLPSLSKLIGP